jgi:acyl-coenzyme A thioesterase PaaI-like protein
MDIHMEAYPPPDPHLKQKILTAANGRIRFWHLLGMRIVDVGKGRARLRLPFDEK